MTGGIIPVGRLLPRLGFQLRLDYVHTTRYRGATRGAGLEWLHHLDGGVGSAGPEVSACTNIINRHLTPRRFCA